MDREVRNADAEKVRLRILNMLDVKYGKCAAPKSGCYLYLAEIYLAGSQSGKAPKFAQAITQAPDDNTIDQVRPKLRWAHVLISLGKTAKALEIAKEVEKSLLEYSGRFTPDDYEQNLRACLNILERGGATTDARSGTVKAKFDR